MKMLKISVITIVICTICSIESISQTSNFCDDTTQFHFKKFVKGQTITVKCDTVVLLNINTFNFFRGLIGNDKINTEIISVSDLKIKQNDSLFNAVKIQALSLININQKLVISTIPRLDSSVSQLTSAKNDINQAKKNLDIAIEIIKKENNKKWKWGAGGALVGAILVKVFSSIK